MAEPGNDAKGRSEGGGAGEATREQKQAVGAAISKMISACIGDMVVVMSRSPTHKHYALADIEWMVLPAVVAGQFFVAEVAHKEGGFRAPLAVVTWAKVSVEVDARLSVGSDARVRLRPEEWTSGETLWLIDMVGDPRALSGALRTLMDGPFKGKTVKVATRDATGAVHVETISALMEGCQAAQDGAGDKA